MIDLEIQRSGSKISLSSGDFVITMLLDADAHETSTSDDFAVWLMLPFAMRRGHDLNVKGTISPSIIENAHRLSEYWSFWRPDLFSPVRVSAANFMEAEMAPSTAPSIMCYSGGMDSTYALVRHVKETGQKPVLLTVNGLDYRMTDPERFSRLMQKTAPVREAFGIETINVQTDARVALQKIGIPSDISFGFNLFSCMFLFQHKYSSGLIAADNPTHYEWARMPYGSNSISNPLFRNQSFRVDTLGLDAARSEKAGYLVQFPEVCNSLTFCKNYSVRPENCGLCQECWRAKAILYSESGMIPDIFLDMRFDPTDLSLLDTEKSNFHVVAVDILVSARRNGRVEEFKGLTSLVEGRAQGQKKPRYQQLLKRTIRKLSGKSAAVHAR